MTPDEKLVEGMVRRFVIRDADPNGITREDIMHMFTGAIETEHPHDLMVTNRPNGVVLVRLGGLGGPRYQILPGGRMELFIPGNLSPERHAVADALAKRVAERWARRWADTRGPELAR